MIVVVSLLVIAFVVASCIVTFVQWRNTKRLFDAYDKLQKDWQETVKKFQEGKK